MKKTIHFFYFGNSLMANYYKLVMLRLHRHYKFLSTRQADTIVTITDYCETTFKGNDKANKKLFIKSE